MEDLCVIQDDEGNFISRDYGSVWNIEDASIFSIRKAKEYIDVSHVAYDSDTFDSKEDYDDYIKYWNNCKLIKINLEV